MILDTVVPETVAGVVAITPPLANEAVTAVVETVTEVLTSATTNKLIVELAASDLENVNTAFVAFRVVTVAQDVLVDASTKLKLVDEKVLLPTPCMVMLVIVAAVPAVSVSVKPRIFLPVLPANSGEASAPV